MEEDWEYIKLTKKPKRKTHKQLRKESKDYFTDTFRRIIRAYTEKQIREIMEKLDAPYTPRFIEDEKEIVVARRKKRKMIDYEQ